eukprot:TRINITY_DN2497_c0_g1_i1.p1 TRINITY_DN2497_c0_g1~~TRINITY_DN2497_c0_g1_i1.p1  ORF type:complete len:366 (-),score=119.17 TRINITY_DN2497_c0_g1_i1:916-2013(-)
MKYLYLFAIIFTIVTAKVMQLDPSNFDKLVGVEDNVLVKFFAPWCGHCKALAPIYEEASEYYKNTKVLLAEVDCDQHKKLCSKFGIRGYPTVKFFPAGKTEPIDYSGQRTVESILSFIHKETGVFRKIEVPMSNVLELTASNFEEKLAENNLFVKFFAPWCGHCKALAPKWEKLSSIYNGMPEAVIAEINCDDHRDICSKYNIRGYPTVKLLTKEGSAIDFSGSREVLTFLNFLNDNTGSHVDDKGGIAEDYGKKFNYAAAAAMIVDGTFAQNQIEENWNHQDTDFAAPLFKKYYEKIAAKVQAEPDWASKELDRLVRLSKKALAPKTIWSVTMRIHALEEYIKIFGEIHELFKNTTETIEHDEM